MLNLVEKFTAGAAEATDEDGVISIEYVLVAAAVVAGVGIVFKTTGIWDKAEDYLLSLIPTV